MSGYQTGGFPSGHSIVHFDDGITLVGGLEDKPCTVEEDLIPRAIQEVIERNNSRFSAVIQSIADGVKESGAV